MLVRLGQPVGIAALGRSACPVLVLHLGRRIDDTGDMAGAGDDMLDRPAEALRAVEDRLGRRDMVLPRREIVDRHRHLLEVEGLAADPHLALGELVVEIAVAQIEGVVRRRHPGRIRIPVEQVEGRRRLALQVVVDRVGPDQVVRPEHVEGARHPRTVEIAGPGHLLLDRADLLLVDEDRELAGLREIDLRREEGRALDALVAHRRHIGQRHAEQRAADAVADRRDLLFPGRLLDRVERGEDAFAHIALEILGGVARIRIDPGNAEDGQPLRHAPADEALLRVEVEDVELVDPGRHDQQRPLQHLWRRGRVLDQLDDLVAEDDLARCRRDIDTDLEGAAVGLADLELAAAGLDILGIHLHAAHEVLAVLLHGLAQQLGIGGDEIGGREGAGDLLDVEAGLLARMRVEVVGLVDHRLGPARADQISLFDEVEGGVVRPVRVLEAGIALVRLGDGRDLLAAGALQSRAPQVHEVAGEGGLSLDDLRGVVDPALGNPTECLDHVAGLVGLAGLGLAALDRLQVGGGDLAVFLDEPAHILRELVEVGSGLGRTGGVLRPVALSAHMSPFPPVVVG